MCVKCSVGEEGERKAAPDSQRTPRIEEKEEKKLRPHFSDSSAVGETEEVGKSLLSFYLHLSLTDMI